MKYINEKIENKIVNEFIEKFPKMKNIGNIKNTLKNQKKPQMIKKNLLMKLKKYQRNQVF